MNTKRPIVIRIIDAGKARPIYGIMVMDGDRLLDKQWIKSYRLATVKAARIALGFVTRNSQFDLVEVHDSITGDIHAWKRSKV